MAQPLTPEPPTYASMGYEILIDPQRVRFLQRNTYGVGLASLISGGIAAIATINIVIGLFVEPMMALVGLGVVVVPALVFGLCFRAWRKRKNAPYATLPGLVVDRASGTWSDPSGRALAHAGQVHARTSYSIGRRTHDIVVRIQGQDYTVYADYALTGTHAREVMTYLGSLGLFRC